MYLMNESEIVIDGVLRAVGTKAQEAADENEPQTGRPYRFFAAAIAAVVIGKYLALAQYIIDPQYKNRKSAGILFAQVG